jgi:hypothetical protein
MANTSAPRVVRAAALACAVTACTAHGGGAAHEAPHPVVERRCDAAETSGPVPLRITAVDESGTPMPRALVSIADAGKASAPAARLETDERGEAEVGVLAGLWRIEITHPGYSAGRYLLDLHPGQSCGVRFELEPAPNEFEF